MYAYQFIQSSSSWDCEGCPLAIHRAMCLLRRSCCAWDLAVRLQ